jgi:macrolide transport system ATP-binding/permease protein
MRSLLAMIPEPMLASMPYLRNLGLNLHVLGFAAGIALLAAALFSLTPMLRLSFRNLRAGLREGDRGYAGTAWRRLGTNLVVIELATAVILLVGAGLLGKSFYKLLHVELGFDPYHFATVGAMAPTLAMKRTNSCCRRRAGSCKTRRQFPA